MRMRCFLKKKAFPSHEDRYVVRIAILSLETQECAPESFDLFDTGKSFTCLMA